MPRKGNPVQIAVYVDGENAKWLIDRDLSVTKSVNSIITAARVQSQTVDEYKARIYKLEAKICELEARCDELNIANMRLIDRCAELKKERDKVIDENILIRNQLMNILSDAKED